MDPTVVQFSGLLICSFPCELTSLKKKISCCISKKGSVGSMSTKVKQKIVGDERKELKLMEIDN